MIASVPGFLSGLIALLLTQGAPPPPKAAAAVVAWREFEAGSFEKARTEGVPVFLYMPAPFGHWDHLMSDITMSDPRVIALLNEKYVPIRIDPILRPDIDIRYNLGGWPTSAFLLPTGHPFVYPTTTGGLEKAGATYYPPYALTFLLEQHAAYFAANRTGLENLATELERRSLERKEVGKRALSADQLEVSITKFLDAYKVWNPDPKTKRTLHPDVDAIELGLYYYLQKGNPEIREVIIRMLTDMARGGIRDHLGGGFHRYAKDSAWRVPGFEKTLQVNAAMLRLYTDAFRLTGEERYLAIADGTASWVIRTLGTQEGWFHTYQAADATMGDDGDYYTWTIEEARAALTEQEAEIMLPAYQIEEWGELVDSAPRRNVIFLHDGPFLLSQRLGRDLGEVTAIFERGTRRMLEARDRRQAPPVGGPLVTDANAAMATALIRAGDSMPRADLSRAGLRAVEYLWTNARSEAGLMEHTVPAVGGNSGPLFVDQVAMTSALIAAYQSTGDAAFLDKAMTLARAADGRFEDSLGGGWTDRVFSKDAPGLLGLPHRSIRDNALFADCLMTLHYLSGEAQDGPLARSAREGLEAWADEFADYGTAGSMFGIAAHRALTPPLEVIVVEGGAEGRKAEGFDPLRHEIGALSHPWKTIRYLKAPDAAADARLKSRPAPAGPAAFFCVGGECAGPFDAAADLIVEMHQFLNRGPAATTTGSPQ